MSHLFSQLALILCFLIISVIPSHTHTQIDDVSSKGFSFILGHSFSSYLLQKKHYWLYSVSHTLQTTLFQIFSHILLLCIKPVPSPGHAENPGLWCDLCIQSVLDFGLHCQLTQWLEFLVQIHFPHQHLLCFLVSFSFYHKRVCWLGILDETWVCPVISKLLKKWINWLRLRGG